MLLLDVPSKLAAKDHLDQHNQLALYVHDGMIILSGGIYINKIMYL